MSTSRAERYILEKLGAGTTALLSLHLSLPQAVIWADGKDAEGRDVGLVGAHALRQLPAGTQYIVEALERLKDGEMPAGLHGVKRDAKYCGN